jgi:hypothetical protein
VPAAQGKRRQLTGKKKRKRPWKGARDTAGNEERRTSDERKMYGKGENE